MDDSQFWRDLAAQFLAIPDPAGALRGIWQYTVGSNPRGEWELQGPLILQGQFGALARRGAMKLPYQGTADLLVAWLEALRLDGDGFRLIGTTSGVTGASSGLNEIGVEAETVHGRLSQLCKLSASYSMKRESAALQAEFQGKSQHDPKPIRSLPSLVGEQIDRLRDESHLSEEELAQKVDLDIRSVQRHIANETIPQARHLRAYERVFSKLLNRRVVISKMP